MEDKNIGEWEAWTYPADFVPQIFVKGTVPTDAEKPVFVLKRVGYQGINEKELILDLTPDAVVPDGKDSAPVETFSESMEFKHYETVFIKTDSIPHVATVSVIKKQR